jgi:hypothetical protein
MAYKIKYKLKNGTKLKKIAARIDQLGITTPNRKSFVGNMSTV